MVNNFNPLVGIIQGQQIEQGLADAQLAGITLREREALKRASGQMGSQNYFAGFEGIPGAERPDYLKELYASGDPEAAMKMETYLAAPHIITRDIMKAGEIERAKKAADFAEMKKMWDTMGGDTGTGNALVPRLIGSGGEAPSVIPSSTTPSGTEVPDTRGVSGVERSMGMTPQGLTLSAKILSPYERVVKDQEMRVKADTLKNAQEAEKRQTLADAHENVRKVNDQIQAVQKAMQTREIPWAEGQARIGQLRNDLATFMQHRDNILRGGTQVAPAPAPVAAAQPAAVAPSVAGPPQFTEKESAAMAVKDREEKITAANKEIENSRLGAQKVAKYKRQVKELFDLVTTQDIGHPAMKDIYGAENVLTMKRANAQVRDLNAAIINMFAEPGQSQMMNTIVERQMQGAVVPSLWADPQLNKKNAAILRSNVEHLSEFPTFLEKWKNTHNNTLDGATDAWINYTENNPLYTFTTDARGRVTVNKVNKPISASEWMDKIKSGGIRIIGDKTFVRQPDGSWTEKQK